MVRPAILLALVACGHSGPQLRASPLFDDSIARAEVVTLANRVTDGERSIKYPDRASSAWLAENADQLRDLWAAVELTPAQPIVDFARFIVIGDRYTGSCEPDVEGAQITADRVVTLELAERPRCRGVEIGRSRVLALPRTLVGTHFLWNHETGLHAFDLGVHATAPNATEGRPILAGVRGQVPLPARGHIALRTLDDGEDVWVAQHDDGEIAVIESGRADGDGSFILEPVRWLPDAQQFAGGVDSYGRANRDYKLMPVQFERAGEAVRIGQDYRSRPPADSRKPRLVVANAFVYRPERRPASSPLELDGPAAPYARFAPGPFAQIADGQLGLVDLDVVFDPPRETRICRVAPGERCPATAPAYAMPIGDHRPLDVIHGPLIVRRRGADVSFVMRAP